MKKVNLLVIASALTFSFGAFAADLCQSYNAVRGTMTPSKVVDLKTTKINSTELAMIQTTVLVVDPSQALSPKSALEVFKDTVDGRNGSLGGDIQYYTVNKKTIAVVTYFPGDNEYGSIFWVSNYGDNTSVNLLGTITDSELNCLAAVE